MRTVARRPLVVIAVVAALALAGAGLALRLEPSASTDTLVNRSSEAFQATERYKREFGEDAIVVLDDVNQTEEMRRAWRTVIRRPGVSLAVPLRRIGVVCASAAGTEPSNDRAPGYGSRR